jgi:hypothetical protein
MNTSFTELMIGLLKLALRTCKPQTVVDINVMSNINIVFFLNFNLLTNVIDFCNFRNGQQNMVLKIILEVKIAK